MGTAALGGRIGRFEVNNRLKSNGVNQFGHLHPYTTDIVHAWYNNSKDVCVCVLVYFPIQFLFSDLCIGYNISGKGVLFQGGIRGVSWASGGWLPQSIRGKSYRGIVDV